MAAHGLLGTELLNAHHIDKLAYRVLFSQLLVRGDKMTASLAVDHALLMDYSSGLGLGPVDRQSIVTRRESLIAAIGEQISDRFTYNCKGNFERSYQPRLDCARTMEQEQLVRMGIDLFEELKSSGVIDETLRTAVGALFAVAKFDGRDMRGLGVAELLGTGQIYVDALAASLSYFRTLRADHSDAFLADLELRLSVRHRITHDCFLLPDSTQQLEKLLALIDRDLGLLPDSIEE